MDTVATAIALDKWIEKVGISGVTVWRWRKRGIIKTINISGRLYLFPQDHAEFLRRAAAGDFAIQPKTPRSPRAKRNS